MITRATLPDGRVLDLASPLAVPEPPTLLGMPVLAVPGAPPCIVWTDRLGMLRARLLGTGREYVRLDGAWKEWPQDAPPDEVL